MEKLKGDVEIVIKGKVHYMRPTFKGLGVMRALCNRYEMELIFAIVKREYGISEITAIIYGGILGYSGYKKIEEMPWTFEELGDIIVLEGMAKYTEICRKYLSQAVSGEDYEDLKKKADEVSLPRTSDPATKSTGELSEKLCSESSTRT